MKNLDKLAVALHQTAARLKQDDAKYQWGHMGQCNVGHLIQTMTGMNSTQIVKSMNHDMDEWTEHAKIYCSGSGQNVDDMFRTMLNYGFTPEDVIHLENLSDRKVLENVNGGFRYLEKNQKNDVAEYMESLADLIQKAA